MILTVNIKYILCLCLWFRASLIYSNKCPTRCNTKQSIYYSASSLTSFRCQPQPSSGVHKTVTTASGTCHIFLCSYLPPTWPTWPVPEAVVTVLCTPDDGCGWHPKRVEWTCRIINRLLCVASRWTVINTDQLYSWYSQYIMSVQRTNIVMTCFECILTFTADEGKFNSTHTHTHILYTRAPWRQV